MPSLLSRAVGSLVLASVVVSAAPSTIVNVQNWVSTGTCSGKSDYGISVSASACIYPTSVSDVPPFRVTSCAGGYAYLEPCDDGDRANSQSYAAGSCYSNDAKTSPQSAVFICPSTAVAQTAGATIDVSTLDECLAGETLNSVSANLGTCLFVDGNNGRTYYAVTACDVGGQATVQMYADSKCSTTSGTALQFDDKSKCNAFPRLADQKLFNVTCYVAGKGPAGPQGSGDLPPTDDGGAASSTGASTLLTAALMACALVVSSTRKSISFGFFLVLALAVFAFSAPTVSAADTYTVRIWSNYANCWASSSGGYTYPSAIVVTDTDGACMQAKTSDTTVAYFAVTACTGNAATFQLYSDATCTTASGAASSVAGATCQVEGLSSISVACGQPVSGFSSDAASAVFFSGADCTGTQSTVQISACTPVNFGPTPVFLSTTCSGSAEGTSMKLKAYADPNCLTEVAGAGLNSTSGTSLQGSCATNRFNTGSFQIASNGGGSNYFCGGQMSAAAGVQVSIVSLFLAAIVALLAKRA